MATISDIQEYIRTNKIPKEIGIKMLSKAEDIDQPATPLERANYHEAPKDHTELESQSIMDTFLPSALIRNPIDTIQSLNPAINLAKGVATSLVSAHHPKANLEQTVMPTLESIPVLNALVSPFKTIGRWSGGDEQAPGALLGSIANLTLPGVGEEVGGLAGKAGGVSSSMLRGAKEGALRAQPRGLFSAPIHGAIKGVIRGLENNSQLPKISPVIDKLASGTSMLPEGEIAPDALETMLGKLRPNPEPVQTLTGNAPRNLTPAGNLSKAIKPIGEPMNIDPRLAAKVMSNKLPKINAPQASSTSINPNESVATGTSMNDMFKDLKLEPKPDRLGEALAKETQANPVKTAEIDNALKSVSAPMDDNPASRALAMAQRRLAKATDPVEIAKINDSIVNLKRMVENLRKHKEMEVF